MKLGSNSRLLVAAALLAGTALSPSGSFGRRNISPPSSFGLTARKAGALERGRYRNLAGSSRYSWQWRVCSTRISKLGCCRTDRRFVRRLFPTQRAGDTIHSPKHCLPGAGWLPVASARRSMPRLPVDRLSTLIVTSWERELNVNLSSIGTGRMIAQ